jgi:hypothetical protein
MSQPLKRINKVLFRGLLFFVSDYIIYTLIERYIMKNVLMSTAIVVAGLSMSACSHINMGNGSLASKLGMKDEAVYCDPYAGVNDPCYLDDLHMRELQPTLDMMDQAEDLYTCLYNSETYMNGILNQACSDSFAF